MKAAVRDTVKIMEFFRKEERKNNTFASFLMFLEHYSYRKAAAVTFSEGIAS